jgi:hypothetical protein
LDRQNSGKADLITAYVKQAGFLCLNFLFQSNKGGKDNEPQERKAALYPPRAELIPFSFTLL